MHSGHSEEMTDQQRTRLFVYDGEGASETGVAMAIQSLRQCTENTLYDVSRITPQEVKAGKSKLRLIKKLSGYPCL